MEVAELKDGEAVEGRGQTGQRNRVVPYLDLCRITEAPPIKARCHEDGADQDMRQGQILDVKEVQALAEDLRLVILFDSDTLTRMAPAEALLEDR